MIGDCQGLVGANGIEVCDGTIQMLCDHDVVFWISHKDNSDADEPIIIESSSASVEADWAQFRGAGGRGISLAEGPLPTLESLEKELPGRSRYRLGTHRRFW